LRGASRAAPRPGQSRELRRSGLIALPLRAPFRVRRLSRDGTAVPGAVRRGRNRRPRPDPARALRHLSGRNPGAGVVRRRPVGLMTENETPVSWLMIEPGWDVVAADGARV